MLTISTFECKEKPKTKLPFFKDHTLFFSDSTKCSSTTLFALIMLKMCVGKRIVIVSVKKNKNQVEITVSDFHLYLTLNINRLIHRMPTHIGN